MTSEKKGKKDGISIRATRSTVRKEFGLFIGGWGGRIVIFTFRSHVVWIHASRIRSRDNSSQPAPTSAPA